jgi:hypothetical protein
LRQQQLANWFYFPSDAFGDNWRGVERKRRDAIKWALLDLN